MLFLVLVLSRKTLTITQRKDESSASFLKVSRSEFLSPFENPFQISSF